MESKRSMIGKLIQSLSLTTKAIVTKLIYQQFLNKMYHNENKVKLYVTVSLGASGDQPIEPEQAKKDLKRAFEN